MTNNYNEEKNQLQKELMEFKERKIIFDNNQNESLVEIEKIQKENEDWKLIIKQLQNENKKKNQLLNSKDKEID